MQVIGNRNFGDFSQYSNEYHSQLANMAGALGRSQKPIITESSKEYLDVNEKLLLLIED